MLLHMILSGTAFFLGHPCQSHPEKNNTRRNEPAFVRSVLLKLAEVRKEEPENLAEIIWENTCRLYGLNREENTVT